MTVQEGYSAKTSERNERENAAEKSRGRNGTWVERHLQYIKAYRKVFYTTLLTKCELNRHLADVNKQAEDMFFRLVKQLAEREGVTEKLKANNQMEWVARMNNIRNKATEIVNHDIIYN